MRLSAHKADKKTLSAAKNKMRSGKDDISLLMLDECNRKPSAPFH